MSPKLLIGQIVALPVRKGERLITSEYSKTGEISCVTFVMAVGGMPVNYTLPANVAGAAKVLMDEKPWTSMRQGPKVEWSASTLSGRPGSHGGFSRNYVEAQVAMIESGQVEAAQIFLPYATQGDGRTPYQLFVENNQRQLGSGGAHE